MKPAEARVFIVEDSASKMKDLIELVEANGGQVVGSVDNRTDAHTAITDMTFPANVGHANVVLIDGNLDKYGSHGTDGKYVFNDGYKRGMLHRVDAAEGVGAVALGCSIDDQSDVAYATGGNLSRAFREDASDRWAAFLEPHPADPVYPTEGMLERMDLSNGFGFAEMMEYALAAEGDQVVTMCSLSVTETKKTGNDEVVTYADELDEPAEISLADLIARAAEWRGVEGTSIKVDSHRVKAVMGLGRYMYVVKHVNRVCKDAWGSYLVSGGTVDKIALSGLSQLPDAYWKQLGIPRPQVEV